MRRCYRPLAPAAPSCIFLFLLLPLLAMASWLVSASPAHAGQNAGAVARLYWQVADGPGLAARTSADGRPQLLLTVQGLKSFRGAEVQLYAGANAGTPLPDAWRGNGTGGCNTGHFAFTVGGPDGTYPNAFNTLPDVPGLAVAQNIEYYNAGACLTPNTTGLFWLNAAGADGVPRDSTVEYGLWSIQFDLRGTAHGGLKSCPGDLSDPNGPTPVSLNGAYRLPCTRPPHGAVVAVLDANGDLDYIPFADGMSTLGWEGPPLALELRTDTLPPTVQVTSPNGGEVVGVGTIIQPTWSASDNVGVVRMDVDLSLDDGATFPISIVHDVPYAATLNWNVPVVGATTTARIRVTVRDADGNSASDVSDAAFALRDISAPTVAVTSPNGSETYSISQPLTIGFAGADNVGITGMDVALSRDGGATYPEVLASNVPFSATLPWVATGPATSRGKVRVTVRDAAGNSATDASDGIFAILDTIPTVTLLSPNGGEAWVTGSAHNVLWSVMSGATIDSVNLDYSLHGTPGPWIPAGHGLANTGSYAWTLPSVPSDSALVRATVFDHFGRQGSDGSNALFRILPSGAPAITVTTPNGGESWAEGSTHPITWTATGTSIDSVNLDYSLHAAAGPWLVVAHGVTNSGLYAWTTPWVVSDSAMIRATAYDHSGLSSSDRSDGRFSIAVPSPPSITVTSPNGGESWIQGTVHSVTWSASSGAAIDSVNLEYSLHAGTGPWIALGHGLGNTGLYSWTIPSIASDSTLVRASVFDRAGLSASDVSNGLFSIVPPAPPAIEVLSPNGGEGWQAGSVHAVTWGVTSGSPISWIDLDYSLHADAGPWLTIGHRLVLDDGRSYNWTLPSTGSDSAMVRATVHDAAGLWASDLSNAVFSIIVPAPPAITLTSPNGGESWFPGSSHAITWSATSGSAIDSVNLDYSLHGGGGPWLGIVRGLPNSGSYSWTLPLTTSDSAVVRATVYDHLGLSATDASNALFSIVPTGPPTIGVTSPNGGETWIQGSVRAVTWTASGGSGIDSVNLDYSLHAASGPWVAIGHRLANAGSYSWTVPAVLSDSALVRATVFDHSGLTASDLSDALFSIAFATPASVTVTSPNGGESWSVPSSRFITWTTANTIGATTVDLAYCLDGGTTYPYTIALGVANTGTYTWTLPLTSTTTARVRVTVHDSALRSASDVSDANFTILPTVILQAPNGGETWASGSTHTISWGTIGATGSYTADLKYSTDGGATFPNAIVSGITGTGYSWPVPADPTSTARVQVTLHLASGITVSDVSDADFSIQVLPPPPPNPNAGAVAHLYWQDADGPALPGRTSTEGQPQLIVTVQGLKSFRGADVELLVYENQCNGGLPSAWLGNGTGGCNNGHFAFTVGGLDGSYPNAFNNVPSLAVAQNSESYNTYSCLYGSGLFWLSAAGASGAVMDSSTEYGLWSIRFDLRGTANGGPVECAGDLGDPHGPTPVSIQPLYRLPCSGWGEGMVLAVTDNENNIQYVPFASDAMVLGWEGPALNYYGRCLSGVLLTGLTASAGPGQVDLSWTVPSPEAVRGVAVERSEEGAGSVAVTLASGLTPQASMHYRDATVLPEHSYEYAVVATARDGSRSSTPAHVTTPASSFALTEVAPNPFRDELEMRYSIARRARVVLDMLDVAGHRVARILDARQDAGAHQLRWKAADGQGRALGSGVYFIRLMSEGRVTSRRVVLLR